MVVAHSQAAFQGHGCGFVLFDERAFKFTWSSLEVHQYGGALTTALHLLEWDAGRQQLRVAPDRRKSLFPLWWRRWGHTAGQQM